MCNRQRGGGVIYCHPNYYEWQTDHGINGWLLNERLPLPNRLFRIDHHETEAQKINIPTLTLWLQVVASASPRADLTIRQTLIFPPQAVKLLSIDERPNFAHLLCSICDTVLEAYGNDLLSIVLCLSFIACLLSPVYVAACTSNKTIKFI